MDIYKNAQIHFPNVFLMFFQQGFYGDQVPIVTLLFFLNLEHRKVVLTNFAIGHARHMQDITIVCCYK